MVSSSRTSFRVAIAGTGVIAAPHTAALKSLPGVNPVAVCDIDETKARTFAQRWGVSGIYSDLATMLEKEKPDAVHVLLPAAMHTWASQVCLTAGCSIFVEKPFCASLEDCQQIGNLAERLGQRIGVNHNVNYMPGLLQALSLARSGALGGIEHVTVQYCLPNPGLARGLHNHWMFSGTDKLMLEIGPHPLSVIYRFLGKITSCSALASGEMLLGNGTRFFHTWQAALACERGTAQFVLSLGKSYPDTWIHILGQDGELFIDLWRSTLRVYGRSPHRRTGILREELRNSASVARQSCSNFIGNNLAAFGLSAPVTWQEVSIRNSIADFYSAMASGAPVPVGADEGSAVVEACEWVVEDAVSRVDARQGAHCG